MPRDFFITIEYEFFRNTPIQLYEKNKNAASDIVRCHLHFSSKILQLPLCKNKFLM